MRFVEGKHRARVIFPLWQVEIKPLHQPVAASSQIETPNQKPNALGRHIIGQKQIRLERLGPPKAEK